MTETRPTDKPLELASAIRVLALAVAELASAIRAQSPPAPPRPRAALREPG